MRMAGSFSLYLQAQYFTGYGESLLGYKQRSDIFRAGFALYR
jgi:outer membrane phospholipase A